MFTKVVDVCRRRTSTPPHIQPDTKVTDGSSRDAPQNSSHKNPHPSPSAKKNGDKLDKEKYTTAATVKDKLSRKSKSLDSVSSAPTAVSGYTELEQLQCPEVDARLSCAQLRRLCNQVKLEWCSPAAYFSAAGSKWEEFEPEWVEPTPPTTDASAHHEPMLAKFDEIWCPELVDWQA